MSYSEQFPAYYIDFLWIKPTDALNSNFIGITTLHVSSSFSGHRQEFLAIHRLWYILRSCDEPFATRSRMELRSRCMAKNSWWWAERLPETCRVVIPIKLEFRASVGFIHKEFVTMHGHTIVKYIDFIHHSHIITSYCSLASLAIQPKHLPSASNATCLLHRFCTENEMSWSDKTNAL